MHASLLIDAEFYSNKERAAEVRNAGCGGRNMRHGADNDSERDSSMTIGTSLFMIAVGAILKYAVTWTLAGINLQVAGVVLMVVGAIGLILGLVMLFTDRRFGVGPPPEL